MKQRLAVRENFVEIDAPDGRMRVFEAAGLTGLKGTVILFPDVLGLHEEVLGFVHRVARQGYRCLAPDVYYRENKDVFRGIAELPEMLAMGKRLRTEGLAADIRALIDYVNGTQGYGRLATIGFCRGGSQAILAAGVVPAQVVSAIAAYPTRLLQESPDTSYSRWFPQLRAEIRILSPGSDELMPRTDLERLAAMFDALRTHYQIRIYPGATHGWSFPSRPEYDTAADRNTWRVAFAAWNRLLLHGGTPASSRRPWLIVGEQRTATTPAHVVGDRE